MASDHCVVLCTCPDKETSVSLAHAMVAMKLAACVNIIPAMLSVYAWEDSIETSEEWQLMIKTRKDSLGDLSAFIKKVHPYEIPEMIAIPIMAGSEAYLGWMNNWLENTQ